MQRGYSREVATLAAEHLAQRGLINEERDVQREVEKCLRKLWGAKRISTHLWSRGFNADAMQGLSELLGEIDFERNCATLIQKHYGGVPDDADDRRRMVAGLSRYGYSISEIRGAMKSLQA
jgi:SOS response regulatory protein OraA/RecX